MRPVVFLSFLAIGSAMAGCAEKPKLVAIRTDGQSIQGNAVLTHNYNTDKAICVGETQKANLSGVAVHGGGLAGLAVQIERQNAVDSVMVGCMAQRGYALVKEEEAEAKKVEFRAIAEAAAQQQKQPTTMTGSIRR